MMPYFVFSPLTWGVLLALLLPLAWRGLARPLRALGLAAIALLLLLCMPLGANALEWLLETRLPPGTRCAPQDDGAIVLLPGGFAREPRDADDYAAFTWENWVRARAASDLWHQRGAGTLWITGGGPYPVKESEMLRRMAGDWKVPDAAIRIETASTTTWDSAFALAPQLAGQRVRLVTSPWHHARALVAFRAAGIDACVHVIGSDVVPFDSPAYLLPQVSAVVKSENALYELVGLAYYRFRAQRLPHG